MGDALKFQHMTPDDDGRLIAYYINKDGERVKVDLTELMAEAAKAAVDEHMKRYHGHML